jgi:hypothetical protein
LELLPDNHKNTNFSRTRSYITVKWLAASLLYRARHQKSPKSPPAVPLNRLVQGVYDRRIPLDPVDWLSM